MRQWLIRLTTLMAFLLVASFVGILIRGVAWSPSEVKDIEVGIELGSTELVKHQRQRVWLTRFSPEQRKKIVQITPFVVVEGGCDTEAEKCLVQSTTNRQGVIVRYVQAKPDTLNNDVVWIGGFIDPTTGAIYDLLGRLYKNSTKNKQVSNSIHFLE